MEQVNLIVQATATSSYHAALEKKSLKETFWAGSPFVDHVSLPSKTKGTFGEKMTMELCGMVYHLSVQKVKGRTKEYDAVIGGHRTEIKTSFAWGEIPANWKWQQIRRIHTYDRVIFLGINPQTTHLWWCSKDDLYTHVFPLAKKAQHHGKKGDLQLYWEDTSLGKTIPSYFRQMDTF